MDDDANISVVISYTIMFEKFKAAKPELFTGDIPLKAANAAAIAARVWEATIPGLANKIEKRVGKTWLKQFKEDKKLGLKELSLLVEEKVDYDLIEEFLQYYEMPRMAIFVYKQLVSDYKEGHLLQKKSLMEFRASWRTR
ncbi:unnamed protein product [Peronospora farinosa]|uniref:Uncharacterized protein n=1 Tax=Peronospora farinosa TaxID=134698 RepID=A0ABN8C8L0_9STRA|nr:unnamed protein product [Peronospora farinosa]